MAAADLVPRSRKALWVMLVIHLVVALALVIYALFMMPKVRRLGSDSETRQVVMKKVKASIAREADPERLRAIALKGWEQADRDWQLLGETWKAVGDGFLGLPAGCFATVFVAWWGLTRKKTAS